MKNKAGKEMSSKKYLSWLYAVIVFALAYTLQRSVALLGLDLHHDTFMYDAASRFIQGGLPYKDFFYQYNLATIFFHALALMIGGLRIAALKIETAIAYAVIALFVYLITAVQGRRSVALVAALFWATLSPFYMPSINGYHPWSTVYMMASVMAGSFLLLLSVLKKRDRLLPVAAGACFALAFWFKQVAFVQIAVVSMWLVVLTLKNFAGPDRGPWILRTLGFIGGLLLGSLPFLYYLTTNQLIEDWFRCAFVFNGYFASSGGSTTVLKFLLRTMLPVSHDFGYKSFIWLLLPLSVLFTLLIYRDRNGTGILFRNGCDEDQTETAMSLLVVLSLAGWIEYFPLPHSFHTQLFMAPAFAFLAISTSEIVARRLWDGRHLLLNFILVLSALDGVYEVARHMIGFKEKIALPRVSISGSNPVQGLNISMDHSDSFLRFYSKLQAENRRYGGRVVPMSVDPLRALVPYSVEDSKKYKMGVDWSWPNEIVEPGFNERLKAAITKRNSIIYADSPVVIPGYVIAALLEMPSPITMTHTLYIPSSDPEVVRPAMSVSHRMLLVPGCAISTQLDQRAFDNRVLRLVEVDKGLLSVGNLSELHVSMVTLRDLPNKLLAYEYKEFFTKIPSEEHPDFTRIYHLNRRGKYVMWEQPDPHELVRFARFLLDRGKIFLEQNRPVYNSTLMNSISDRPVLIGECNSCGNKQLLWMKGMPLDARDKLIGRLFDGPLYLGIPNDYINPEDTVVFYIQAVSESGRTWSTYVYYVPDPK